MTRYAAAAQQMYKEIDCAVAKFLKNVSSNKSPQQEQVTSEDMPGDRNSIKKTRNADAIPRATDEECGSLHVMEDEDAPIDVEAFHPHIVENNSEDDDFVSVRKKRKHCQPKNCQPATQRNKKCIRVKNATKKSEKAKHGLEQIILTTTIQTTEPTFPDPDAQ